MAKINCWEFKKCGREPGGAKAAELGICPATTFTAADGFCEGKNAGRGCAYVTGTLCGGVIQGTFKDKEKNCLGCAFYQDLIDEHDDEATVLAFNKYVEGKK